MRAMDVPEGARCARHPEAPAQSLCARCGNYSCVACTIDRDTDVYCLPCSRRFFGFGGSWMAVIGAILGFVGIACAPCGPIAIILGAIDLSRIAAKRAPNDGWKLDVLALLLGAAGTAVWAYIIWLHYLSPAPPPSFGEDF